MAAKTASLTVNIIAEAAKAKSGLSEAQLALKKFAKEFDAAEGASAKFKAGTSAAFDFVKKNAITFAAGAAAAIGTFVAKSVMGFQQLALEAGKFSDATGLSTEQASRFIEVAGDIGVEASQVEKSIGFMNKTLGNSPQLFKDLGIEIERTSSGATDVNGTFLNVIDRLNRIQDPAARAAAGTKLLGRSWTELSELVAMGAGDLSKALASVADNKIVTDRDKQDARDLRDEIDRLKDTWEGFANNIGQTLIPALADALGWVNKLIEGLDKLPGGADAFFSGSFENANKFVGIIEDLVGGLFDVGDESQKTYVVTDKLKEAWIGGYRAMITAKDEARLLGSNMRDLQIDVEGATTAWKIFKDGLNIKAESIRLTQDIEDFRVKWAGTTEEAKRKSREYQLELIAIQTQLANSALAIAGLATTAQNTRIRLLIETGQLERALSLIGAIQAGMNNLAGSVTPDRVERILGQAPPPSPRAATPAPAPSRAPAKAPAKAPVKPAASFGGPKVTTKRYAGLAAGGTLLSSGGVIVGEFGPELLNLPRGASVTPNIPQRMAGGGQTIINIQVQAGLVSSPDQVGAQIIDAIRRAERRSGQVFASA